MIRIVAIALCAALLPISARAASITASTPLFATTPRINIDGEIVPGDASAFADICTSSNIIYYITAGRAG